MHLKEWCIQNVLIYFRNQKIDKNLQYTIVKHVQVSINIIKLHQNTFGNVYTKPTASVTSEEEMSTWGWSEIS